VKDKADQILRSEQARYLEGLLPPRDALLAEIERAAARDDVPIVDPEVGLLLRQLVT
jgi:predicted O-methyltransferase YrrM